MKRNDSDDKPKVKIRELKPTRKDKRPEMPDVILERIMARPEAALSMAIKALQARDKIRRANRVIYEDDARMKNDPAFQRWDSLSEEQRLEESLNEAMNDFE